MLLASFCVIELGIIVLLCRINNALHHKKTFYEQKYKYLKSKLDLLVGKE